MQLAARQRDQLRDAPNTTEAVAPTFRTHVAEETATAAARVASPTDGGHGTASASVEAMDAASEHTTGAPLETSPTGTSVLTSLTADQEQRIAINRAEARLRATRRTHNDATRRAIASLHARENMQAPHGPLSVPAEVEENVTNLCVRCVLESDGNLQNDCFCRGHLEPGDNIIRLPCLHTYHDSCILRWFSTNTIDEVTDDVTFERLSMKCPCCNVAITAMRL